MGYFFSFEVQKFYNLFCGWPSWIDILRYKVHSLNMRFQICVLCFQKKYIELQFLILLLFPCQDLFFRDSNIHISFAYLHDLPLSFRIALISFFICSRVTESNCFQFHGLQPARLLYPWDFPGKNTGEGRYFFHWESSQSRDRVCIFCMCLLHYRWILYF